MTKMQKVYGGSLYELAKEEGLSSQIHCQLTQVLAILEENPDYLQLLSTLSIPKQDRCRALDEAFGGRVEKYLLNFMKMLCEKGEISQLSGCEKEYRRLYNLDNGIVEICAVTAVAMSAAVQKKLKDKLEAVLAKTVELTNRVDPACMGGVLLQLPDRQLDGTVRNRLDALRAELQAAVL